MRTSREEELVRILDGDDGKAMHDPIVINMMKEKLNAALSYNPEGKLSFGSTSQGGAAVLMIIKTTLS
jgi:hypothetical protein